MLKSLTEIGRFALYGVLRNRRGIAEIGTTGLLVVGALVLGGALIAFVKGGGLTWLNNTLNSITSYTP